MGLYQDILSAPVTDLDLRELITVSPDTTVRQAMDVMRAKKLGCAVVVDDQGKPLGKFTERVLVKMLLEHGNLQDRLVRDHLDEQQCYVKTTDTIAAVLSCMQQRGARFVIVVDDLGKAIALTGQKGLMEYIAEHFPRQVKVQPMRSTVSMDEREGA